MTLPNPTTPKTQDDSPFPVGYTVIQAGEGVAQEHCILTAHLGSASKAILRQAGAVLEIEQEPGGARIELHGLPIGLAGRLPEHADRVHILSVDGLSRPRTFSSIAGLINGLAAEPSHLHVHQGFNAFLNRCIASGKVKVTHIRLGGRQAENEVFARKALSALLQLAPQVSLSASVVPLPSKNLRTSAADAALRCADHAPHISRYLQAASGAPLPPEPEDKPDLDLFCALRACAGAHLDEYFGGFKALANSAAAVLETASAEPQDATQHIKEAADSVLLQSFADVHALSCIAAVDGNRLAMDLLESVYDFRLQSGDFSTFSLAPLSFNTRAALQMQRVALKSGVKFSNMTREELFTHSRILAMEGLAVWLEENGVSAKSANTLLQGIENLAAIAHDSANR